MIRLFLLCLVFLLDLLPLTAFADVSIQTVDVESSYSIALSNCQTNAAAHPSSQVSADCTAGSDPGNGLSGYQLYLTFSNGVQNELWYDYTGAGPPTCTQGYMPAAGSTYQYASSDGSASYNGCCLSLLLGGPNSGMEVETGVLCAGGGTSAPAKPASETSNPDGSKTYCDQNSGKCVTYNPNGSNPASSSSSANNSTDSTSQTNTSGSTSTTNSTSNTSGTTSGSDSGTGTGGTGSGSYSGTTTTTGTTDNPATSSSTSTKCDTGVCDVGNADGNIGNLYTPSTDTPASVYAAFKQSVSSSAIVSSVTGFFSLSASGSCPVYTMAASKYVPAQTFDYFCQPGVLSYLQLAGLVVLAVGAFCAFRIALY